VPELDDDNIVSFYGFDDLVETAFTRVGTRTATANGFVDYREGERVRKIDAPACLVVRSQSNIPCSCLFNVPVMAPFALAIVESPAKYTVCARLEISPLGAPRAVAANASTETTCEYNIVNINMT
jgi:hypothetical protein